MRLLRVVTIIFLAGSLQSLGQAQETDRHPISESPKQHPSAPAYASQQPDIRISASSDPETQEPLVFTGRVVRDKGQIKLLDPVTKVSYQLDDEFRVKQLFGKHVKVTGTLSLTSNTIHIHSVEPLS